MGGWLSLVILSFLKRKEVIIMDHFPEFLKEVLKGVVRAISAYVFQKTFLNKEKTTPRRHKQKGGSPKN